FTCSSILLNVWVESTPIAGYRRRVFSKVVTWSHFAQQSRFKLPSPFLIGTRMLNFLCSTVVIPTTQTSKANLLIGSTESTIAGLGLSKWTMYTSPRLGYHPTGTVDRKSTRLNSSHQIIS